MIAALYVQKDGCYFGLDDVDPWDEERDATRYAGPHPVVAHPPCARWCRLAGLVEARWGHKRGDDGGLFEAALDAVRTWGGVLEHPAYSDAFTAYGLPIPSPGGGWQRGLCGGWSCHVEQGCYGHPAKKATWLYAYGVEDLPSLRWGSEPDQNSDCPVRWHNGNPGDRPRLKASETAATPEEFRDELIGIAKGVQYGSKRQRSATPPPFRDLLIGIAGSCGGERPGNETDP